MITDGIPNFKQKRSTHFATFEHGQTTLFDEFPRSTTEQWTNWKFDGIIQHFYLLTRTLIKTPCVRVVVDGEQQKMFLFDKQMHAWT